MSWNYRVVKKLDTSNEEYFEFVEAYYENGVITGWVETGILAESHGGLQWILGKLTESLEKEILTPETILGSK